MARRVKGAFLAATLLAASPAIAAERHDISVPGGRLGDAVIALGRQTGGNIGIADAALANLRSNPVSGRMSAERALALMLKGSAARAQRVAGGGIRIVAGHAPRIAAPPPRPPAEAFTQDPAEGAEIVVTASKRAVPLSAYAGTVEILDAAVFRPGEAASGTEAIIGRVASLSSTYVGSGRNKLFVRAIADSGFAGPTQATTGQYLGDMRLNYAAPDPDLRLYDIGAVEVLEGPQGTLYGAGSMGGIIRLVPNAPVLNMFGGLVGSGVNLTQHGDVGGDISATINAPLVENRAALRVVGYLTRDGGYIDNALTGAKDTNTVRTAGGRAALRIVPNDAWTIDLSALYQRTEGDDAQYATRSVRRLERESLVPQPYLADYWLTNARIERQWDDMSLVSTFGYVRHLLDERYDATTDSKTPQRYRQRNLTRLFSSETRLSRDLHDGLGWLVGFSFLDSRSTIRRSLGPEDHPAPTTGVRNMLTEWTIFGETSVELAPRVVLTAGGRYTNSRLQGEAMDAVDALPSFSMAELRAAEAEARRRENVFLPSAGIITDAVPGVTLYLRYQEGFRPGGLAVDDYRVRRFRNDRISTIEAGMRHGVPGVDPVALSASIAYADWRDIQADLIDRQGMPTTINIGDGRITTLEGRIVLRPIPALVLDGSAIYNDSRLTQPDTYLRTLFYDGARLSLPNVANLGARLAAEYRLSVADGDVRLSASARYIGKSRLGVGPIYGRQQGDYVDTTLAASWSRGPLRVSATLTNIFDALGNRFALGTPFDLTGDDYTPMRPRTLRVGVDFAF